MPWKDDNDGKTPHAAGGPWSGGDGGSGGNGGSPWNRPGGSGGGGSGGGGSDIEEQMRRMQERFRRGIGGRGGGSGSGSGGRGIGPFSFLIIAVVALIAWLSTGVVLVDAGQQAAIFRFGKFETNLGSGIHVHLPVPIERHVLVDVENQRQISIGDTRDESLMITEDENIVDIQFSVFWKVSTAAPQDFILNVKEPEQAVRMVAESVMREVVGKSSLQSVITTERDTVENEVRTQSEALLDDYRAGIEVIDVQIAKSDPPQQVIEAFNDVNKAEQDAEANINDATGFANQVVPEARGEAQRILQQAEGYRDQVIADANGEAARFTSIYEEYRLAPQVTRERMYLETIERVLGNAEKTILDSESGAVPYLPLDRVQR
ncbi:MAG: FtsH protease activity modulator HflK [Alphaproteobacteria bacterium]|jgi:membrane protease subunit HflK|nr:FtsH protease activity modulator HflK [Alphaproteobacteria bacterium]